MSFFDFIKRKEKNTEEQQTNTTRNTKTKVIVYSTSNCAWCNKVKQYLKQKKVRYKEYNIEYNLAKKDEMVRLSGQMGVPVVIVNNKVVVGFDREKIDRYLNS